MRIIDLTATAVRVTATLLHALAEREHPGRAAYLREAAQEITWRAGHYSLDDWASRTAERLFDSYTEGPATVPWAGELWPLAHSSRVGDLLAVVAESARDHGITPLADPSAVAEAADAARTIGERLSAAVRVAVDSQDMRDRADWLVDRLHGKTGLSHSSLWTWLDIHEFDEAAMVARRGPVVSSGSGNRW